jgi:hypothetical protein
MVDDYESGLDGPVYKLIMSALTAFAGETSQVLMWTFR